MGSLNTTRMMNSRLLLLSVLLALSLHVHAKCPFGFTGGHAPSMTKSALAWFEHAAHSTSCAAEGSDATGRKLLQTGASGSQAISSGKSVNFSVYPPKIPANVALGG